ncbi:LPXTG cell wall anchor domain-containing protein, partial [Enterococcus sp. S181_ASV_20]|nr:LPXTG cell wall anchor domain-containing protein [Enterococcus sp. S181_ASV_20]
MCIRDRTYYLPNYLTSDLPDAGGYMRVYLAVLGVILLGSAVLIFQNRKKKEITKGKSDEKED